MSAHTIFNNEFFGLFITYFIMILIHLPMFIANVWLMTIGGIPDGCMRMISIWMICDAIGKLSRCYAGQLYFTNIMSTGLYIWNIINLIMLDCDDIYKPYYNYAIFMVVYDSIMVFIGIILLIIIIGRFMNLLFKRKSYDEIRPLMV